MYALGSDASCQPQTIGVLSPQPPCSNPGFGTTFADVARACGGSPSRRAAVTIRRVASTFTLHTSLDFGRRDSRPLTHPLQGRNPPTHLHVRLARCDREAAIDHLL